MKIIEVLQQSALSVVSQERISTNWTRWIEESSRGCHVHPQFELDLHLSLNDRLFLLMVFDIPVYSQELIEERFFSECRRLCLRGRAMDKEFLPRMLGNARKKKDFVSYLVATYVGVVFISKSLVERFVNKLISPNDNVFTEAEQSVLLSEYAAWCTWNSTDLSSSSDPFHFAVQGCGDSVRASLGLKLRRRRRSPSLILLRYRRPKRKNIYIPTIADAAGYEYFKPAIDQKFGRTKPWPLDELPASLEHFKPKPQPEGLHRPIEMRYLEKLEIWN